MPRPRGLVTSACFLHSRFISQVVLGATRQKAGYIGNVQRHKKTGEALTADDGSALPLTSHTLAPVPVAIGGKGLPDHVIFRKDLPDAGLANITGATLPPLPKEALHSMHVY